MDMFRGPKKNVSVFREKYVEALMADENSEEVLNMRSAMEAFHNNLNNIILLPHEENKTPQSSSSVTNNSIVSNVITRRNRNNLKKRINEIKSKLSCHFASLQWPYYIFFFHHLWKFVTSFSRNTLFVNTYILQSIILLFFTLSSSGNGPYMKLST